MIMFKADFDARYEYHPPNLLSDWLPTRADNTAKIDFFSYLVSE